MDFTQMVKAATKANDATRGCAIWVRVELPVGGFGRFGSSRSRREDSYLISPIVNWGQPLLLMLLSRFSAKRGDPRSGGSPLYLLSPIPLLVTLSSSFIPVSS